MINNPRKYILMSTLLVLMGMGLSGSANAGDDHGHQQGLLLRAPVVQGIQSYQCAPEGIWKLSQPMAILRDK